MYSFDCINKYFSSEKNKQENISIGKPDKITQHVTTVGAGIKKATIYGKESHQYHIFNIYEYHPLTRKKIDGGIVYQEDIIEIHNKDIITEEMKNDLFEGCNHQKVA